MDRHKSAIALLLLLTTSLSADNWPQWRGPEMNGISRETGLPVKFGPDEGVTWKLAMPAWSGSTPIIWNDHLFLNVAPQGKVGSLVLWAIDRNTGRMRWERPIADGNNQQRKQNMSSPSPVTDGRTVWVMTGVGVLKAFDFNGTELWMRDIQKDYGRFGLNWGYASSPLLDAGMLYVQVLHGMRTDDPSYVMKIDGASGKTLWKVERPTRAIRESPDSYTTPALLKHAGGTEIVITGGDCVTGHDPATGKERWRVEGLNPDNDPNYRIVASPVVHSGMVYAPTRERPLLAIKAGVKVWEFHNGPDVPTPVTDGTYFYSVNDRGIVYCLDAKTGKAVYGPERLKPATYSSSLVLADGKIYIMNEDGLLTVFRAGPKFEILAENPFNDYVLSSVAISDGQLFVRTAQTLYCFGKRKRA